MQLRNSLSNNVLLPISFSFLFVGPLELKASLPSVEGLFGAYLSLPDGSLYKALVYWFLFLVVVRLLFNVLLIYAVLYDSNFL